MFSASFLEAEDICLQKGGDGGNPLNYRTLAFLKILTCLTTTQERKSLTRRIGCFQNGFIPGRQTLCDPGLPNNGAKGGPERSGSEKKMPWPSCCASPKRMIHWTAILCTQFLRAMDIHSTSSKWHKTCMRVPRSDSWLTAPDPGRLASPGAFIKADRWLLSYSFSFSLSNHPIRDWSGARFIAAFH